MSNWLEARCPKCGNTDQLDVAATVWLRLWQMNEAGRHMWIPEYDFPEVVIGERCRLCDLRRSVTGRADPPETALGVYTADIKALSCPNNFKK